MKSLARSINVSFHRLLELLLVCTPSQFGKVTIDHEFSAYAAAELIDTRPSED